MTDHQWHHDIAPTFLQLQVTDKLSVRPPFHHNCYILSGFRYVLKKCHIRLTLNPTGDSYKVLFRNVTQTSRICPSLTSLLHSTPLKPRNDNQILFCNVTNVHSLPFSYIMCTILSKTNQCSFLFIPASLQSLHL